jgi:hypothetical protein
MPALYFIGFSRMLLEQRLTLCPIIWKDLRKNGYAGSSAAIAVMGHNAGGLLPLPLAGVKSTGFEDARDT